MLPGFDIMSFDEEAYSDYRTGDHDGKPAASHKFFKQRDHQDAGRDGESHDRQQKSPQPVPSSIPVMPPVDAQAKQRQTERQKHVDAVEHDEHRHFTLGPKQYR